MANKLNQAVENCKKSKGWDEMPYKLHQNIDELFRVCENSVPVKALEKLIIDDCSLACELTDNSKVVSINALKQLIKEAKSEQSS